MGWKSIYKAGKRVLANRKFAKSIRKRLGLTSKSKWVRQTKRSLGIGNSVAYTQPVSASDVGGYQYNGRSVSQLMGGIGHVDLSGIVSGSDSPVSLILLALELLILTIGIQSTSSSKTTGD